MKSMINNFTAIIVASVALFHFVKYRVDTFLLILRGILFSLLEVPYLGGNK